MRWIAIACALGGGCASRGVAIEVTSADPRTATVELFIGNAQVTMDVATCPDGTPASCVIGPPDPTNMGRLGQFYSGSGWLGDAARATRVLAVDGSAGFRIEPDADATGGQKISLLAVGLDDQEMPTGMFLAHDIVVSDEPRVLEMELVAARYIEPAGTDLDRVQIWRRPGDAERALSACALVERTDHVREWFVPHDDTDCDGAIPGSMTAPECGSSDFNYCGRYPNQLSESTCVARSEAGTACRFAGPQCVDAGPLCPAGATCLPTNPRACLPPEVCSNVGMTPCNTLDANCVGKALGDLSFNSVIPSISCTFALASLSPPTPCSGGWPTIPAQLLTPILQGSACSRIELATIEPVTFGGSVAISPTSDLQLMEAGCTGTLELGGGAPPSEANVLVGVFSADGHKRYVRLNFDAIPNCTAVSQCSYRGPSNYSFPCN